MEPVLRFDGVWKRFKRGDHHDSLRDLIPSLTRRLMRRQRDNLGAREFWAISDLSFEVKPGEVLGIIGPNGAGKSTTLKILNRIMDPTRGEVHAVGKIGALIEVSAGFHYDLTGRQNVFLQGAIMGMRKAEVQRKFDEIVEFAGVGDFIDTPVKRYSSGMNARLGFSIAAHLESEILIIDEVLSVGDHEFQQRAFARIQNMARAGAPVVLVSHQLERIAELCTKAILLERGAVRTSGSPAHCINEYLHGDRDGIAHVTGAHGIYFRSFVAEGGNTVYSGEELTLRVDGRSDCKRPEPEWVPAFRILSTKTGLQVHAITGRERGIAMPSGEFQYQLDLQMNVQPGTYIIEPLIWDNARAVDVVVGPRVHIEVLERLKFWGDIQLNTRWTEHPVRETENAPPLEASLQRV